MRDIAISPEPTIEQQCLTQIHHEIFESLINANRRNH